MPAESMFIVVGIFAAFTVFGVILAASDFYTRSERSRPGSETE